MPHNPDELRNMIAELKEKRQAARLEQEAWVEERWSSQPGPLASSITANDPPKRLV